ncbi:MAG TPA: aspartate carbamoyltransferase regulatory subunit, partial [Planctomycetota bacterium]|nr:aspartate carbamoyltransferase regulatory subunit [Planctomycetota bacterium]
VDKFTPTLPEQIENMIRCPNPSCISTAPWMSTKFTVLRTDPIRVRCHYCERSLKKEEIELL